MLIHTCEDYLGLFKNEGYVLLSNQPVINPLMMLTIHQTLSRMGVDLTQTITFPPYDNSKCATMMS